MKKLILYISLLTSYRVYAQELTLEAAMERAKSGALTQAASQQLANDIQLKIQKSKRIPLIYGEGNVQRNLIVPVTPVPAIAFNPNAAPGEITPLRFATDWSAKAGLQFSVDLFNPTNRAAITEAKINKLKGDLDYNDANADLRKNIIDLYAQVVLAQQQEAVAAATLKTYTETLAIIEARFNAGRVDAIEKNNAQKKYLELEQLLKEASAVVLNKQIALVEFLDFDINDTFTTQLSDIYNQIKPLANYKIEQLSLEEQLASLKINNIKLEALPKISINGYYGSQFFNNDLKLFNSEYWYGNSFINVSLRLPITEVFERNLTAKRLRAEYDIAKNKVETAIQHDEIKKQTNSNNVKTSASKIEQLQKTVALVAENVNILTSQVQQGRILVTQLNNEVETYLDQNKKLWQAEYDYLKALLEQ